MEANKQTVFMQLYSPVHKRIAQYCRIITGNDHDAKDLLNDTLLTAYENFEKLRDNNAFNSYLIGIANNIHHKNFRRKQRVAAYNEDLIRTMEDSGPNPQLAAEYRLLFEKLALLPDKQREAILMFEVSDLSLDEIQKIQGGTLSAVKQRLKRGREKLLQMLNM